MIKITTPDRNGRERTICGSRIFRPSLSVPLATNSSGHTAHQTRPKPTAIQTMAGHQIPQISKLTILALA